GGVPRRNVVCRAEILSPSKGGKHCANTHTIPSCSGSSCSMACCKIRLPSDQNCCASFKVEYSRKTRAKNEAGISGNTSASFLPASSVKCSNSCCLTSSHTERCGGHAAPTPSRSCARGSVS